MIMIVSTGVRSSAIIRYAPAARRKRYPIRETKRRVTITPTAPPIIFRHPLAQEVF